MARLVPYSQPVVKRQFGQLRGQIWIAPDFDELPEEVAAAFRGDLE